MAKTLRKTTGMKMMAAGLRPHVVHALEEALHLRARELRSEEKERQHALAEHSFARLRPAPLRPAPLRFFG